MAHPNRDPEFVTIREAQAVTGLSRSTLDRAIARGDLPVYETGLGKARPRIRLRLSDLVDLIAPRPVLRARVVCHDPHRPTDRAFTLMELLVVVVIIGILAAIAIPVFLNQKAKAYDASVKSDLRSAGQAVENYWGTDGASWDSLRSATGTTATAPTTIALASPYGGTWGNVPGADPINASRGTSIGLTSVVTPTGAWTRPTPGGEFCLVATNPKSRWNRAAGSGAISYDRALYYDSIGGGVSTIRDLARLVQGGGEPACYGYAQQWLAAGGQV